LRRHKKEQYVIQNASYFTGKFQAIYKLNVIVFQVLSKVVSLLWLTVGKTLTAFLRMSLERGESCIQYFIIC